MTYFADLEPCTYFGRQYRSLVAVGWHDNEHPFATGPVEKSVFHAIAKLLRSPWQPFACAGAHTCELCRFSGGPTEMMIQGMRIAMGSTNLFIPTTSEVFVMPSLALHYMDAHGWCPPKAFVDAVAACPSMKSIEGTRT